MISYIEGLDEFREGEDIQHYGRLGMKWYQHKFGDTDGRAAYAKKGVNRIGKQEKVSGKQHARANAYHDKSVRAEKKANKADSKIRKTVNFINKHLSDVSIDNMTPEEIATARRYSLAFLEKQKSA